MAQIWKGYQHGIDLGGWFSQCDHTRERYDTFIVREDLKTIASWGLDHVRLPVDYELLEDENGAFLEEGFARLERAFSWCRENGLNMVLDLHKARGFSFDDGEAETGFFDSEAYQEEFYRLWEELARRFAPYGDCVAFELLNEVTDKAYCEVWNRIADTCIQRIRAIAPDTCILVGGYWNNSIEALEDLALPQDKGIIYNFHCYDPIVFTHQGAYWVKGMDPGFRFSLDRPLKDLKAETERLRPIETGEFDGLDLQAPLSGEYFEKRMAKAARVAEERGVRLYCGEYGVIDLATPEDTVNWYRAISAAFERYGIGRAAWSYRAMDFGLSDERLKGVLPSLIPLL